MNKFLKLSCILAIILLISAENPVKADGCTNNDECADLCGFAGGGVCVDRKYCMCNECPSRSIYELANLPKVCSLDPTCTCPAPVLSITSGRIYSGHRCLQGTSMVCICFCTPTTAEGVVEVLKCAVPKGGGSSTTTSTTTASPE